MRITPRQSIVLPLALLPAVLSAPIPPTPIQTVGFTSSSGRGTISLIASCLGTLSLAVYSVLHLNVHPSEGRGTHFAKKLGWVLMGMVCPEIVMWMAIGQWEVAKELCERGKEISTHPQDKKKWGLLEYGFLATMGGFKVTVDEQLDKVTVDEQPDHWILCNGATLTPLGVLCVEKMKRLPYLNRKMITDKSKIDYLAKGFSVIQGIWFLVQIISRWVAHLQVTLLELITLAHTICAIALWGFWWRRKPKDVTEPVSIKITPSEAAYLSYDCRFKRLVEPVVEQMDGHVVEETGDPGNDETEGQEGKETLLNDPRAGYGKWKDYIPKVQEGLNVLRRVPGRADPKVQEWENLTEYQKIRRIDKAFKKDGKCMLIPGEETKYYRWESDQPIHLNQKMIEKLERLPAIEDDDKYSKLKVSPGMAEFNDYANCPNLYLTHEVSNTPDPKLLCHRSENPFNLVLLLVFVYSCVHAASWKSQFPTTIEQIWWQLAIVVIAGGSLVLWGLFKVSAEFAKDSAGRGWIASVMGVVGFVIAVMRLYFLVEAIVSLRSLPSTAYDTVNWINNVLLPHIG